ncbi:MAG: hypothetical protein WDZ35_00210 [Crocinitomicaceae bacterium]
MKNKIISYANLTEEVKKAFRMWLDMAHRELISFPLKGKHVSGYIFNHDQEKYLVIMSLQQQQAVIPSLQEIEQIDLGESIEDL